MGGKKRKDFFLVLRLVLRHRQEITSLTVSNLHVSHVSQVLCGFSTDLLGRGSSSIERIGKWGSNTNSISLSPSHRPVMSEIVLKRT